MLWDLGRGALEALWLPYPKGTYLPTVPVLGPKPLSLRPYGNDSPHSLGV